MHTQCVFSEIIIAIGKPPEGGFASNAISVHYLDSEMVYNRILKSITFTVNVTVAYHRFQQQKQKYKYNQQYGADIFWENLPLVILEFGTQSEYV